MRMNQLESIYNLDLGERRMAEEIFSALPPERDQASAQLIWVRPTKATDPLLEISEILRPNEIPQYWDPPQHEKFNSNIIIAFIDNSFLEMPKAPDIFPELLRQLPRDAIVFAVDLENVKSKMPLSFAPTLSCISLSVTDAGPIGKKGRILISPKSTGQTDEEYLKEIFKQIPDTQRVTFDSSDKVSLVGSICIDLSWLSPETANNIQNKLNSIFGGQRSFGGITYDTSEATVSWLSHNRINQPGSETTIKLYFKPRLAPKDYGGYLFRELPQNTFHIEGDTIRYDGRLFVDLSDLPEPIRSAVSKELTDAFNGDAPLFSDLKFKSADRNEIFLNYSNEKYFPVVRRKKDCVSSLVE